MNYEGDRQYALKEDLHFEVCSKSGQGRKWETIQDDISDLHDAMSLAAKSTGHFEVGVFVLRPGGGYIYWTSKNPELLNSTVLSIEITIPNAEQAPAEDPLRGSSEA